jgi:hypoxanthine phosphoribosyltransferase
VYIIDKAFELFISAEEIQQCVSNIAREIERDYEGKEVLFIGVLNGSFMFAADLLKEVDLLCEISFIKLASYDGRKSSGNVHELIGLVNDLKDKHVIVIEDIVDTGLTLSKIRTMIDYDHPASLSIATLLFKPDVFKGKHAPKYIGKAIPDHFVVGYGLDYNQYGRNTKDIYKLKA